MNIAGMFHEALSEMLADCADPAAAAPSLVPVQRYANAREMLEDHPAGAHFMFPVSRSLDRQPFMAPYVAKRTFIPFVESPGESRPQYQWRNL